MSQIESNADSFPDGTMTKVAVFRRAGKGEQEALYANKTRTGSYLVVNSGDIEVRMQTTADDYTDVTPGSYDIKPFFPDQTLYVTAVKEKWYNVVVMLFLD